MTSRYLASLVVLALCSACADAPPPRHEQALQRIAFGSCAMQQLEQPIWDAVRASDPDLFLFLGDAIYGDWDGEKVVPATVESLRRDWSLLASKPGFRRLRETVPVLAVWDNHDYGTHDGGAEFPLKQQSERIFLDFFDEPADAPRRARPGLHGEWWFGPEGRRVQVLLLDTRSFKGPPVRDPRSASEKARLGVVGKYLPQTDTSVTLLGEAQWAWLEERLSEPADLRILASSTQIVPDQKGMDEWGNYPHERQRLLDLCDARAPGPALLLSGNVHFAEVSELRLPSGRTLVEFTSSGLTHVEPKYAAAPNGYRAAGPLADLNFGVVEIDWEDRQLVLTACRVDGTPALRHQVGFDRTEPR